MLASVAREVKLERTLPTDPVIRKHDRGVETSSIELAEARLRVGVARRELVEVERRRQAFQQALSKHADTVDVARTMRPSQGQTTIAEHQPGVTEVVLRHVQGNVAILRIDVLPPHPGRLEEVGVGVDEQGHCGLPSERSKETGPFGQTLPPGCGWSPKRTEASKSSCRRRSRCPVAGAGRGTDGSAVREREYPLFLTVVRRARLEVAMVRGEGTTVARGVTAIEAFDFVLDPVQYTKADTKMVWVTKLADVPDGMLAREDGRFLGRFKGSVITRYRWNRPNHIDVTLEHGVPKSLHAWFEIEDVSGGVRIRHVEELDLGHGVLGAFHDLVAGRWFARSVRAEVAEIGRLLEEGQRGQPFDGHDG